MSSPGQATSSTENFQSIINALAEYIDAAEIKISNDPSVAAVFEQANSPVDILQLLQGRVEAFREYRDENRKLISCLKPTVKIISKIIEGAVSLVSRTSRDTIW